VLAEPMFVLLCGRRYYLLIRELRERRMASSLLAVVDHGYAGTPLDGRWRPSCHRPRADV
jgi:hypothetical protein